MKDLKVLNLEKYVGCTVSTGMLRSRLVVGYKRGTTCLIVVGDKDGRYSLGPDDVIFSSRGHSRFWYVDLSEIKDVKNEIPMRDAVGLNVMYKGQTRRCVGYNEIINACILQKSGGWARFSKGDVIGVREDLDAGFEYADYNEVEVL